ncbi:MAG: hypothetical protein CL956_05555 [Erythrobacteraceae bacterium]|nr:hypothetical protein [Erythrobacteraceae bacterium]|tara:strand:+ start:481 stop:993 length:513 start_codon:yes stop_codon:yes gene_type:complete
MKKLLLSLSLAFCATSATANSDNWRLKVDENGSCTAGGVFGYEGTEPTILAVSYTRATFEDNDYVAMFIRRKDWTYAEGDELGTATIVNGNGSTWRGKAEAGEGDFLLYLPRFEFDALTSQFGEKMEVQLGGKAVLTISTADMYKVRSHFDDCRSSFKKMQLDELLASRE